MTFRREVELLCQRERHHQQGHRRNRQQVQRGPAVGAGKPVASLVRYTPAHARLSNLWTGSRRHGCLQSRARLRLSPLECSDAISTRTGLRAGPRSLSAVQRLRATSAYGRRCAAPDAADTGGQANQPGGSFSRQTSQRKISPHTCSACPRTNSKGRKPGSIGERMTTTYLVDQFQRMGLKPGNGDSYLQSVPMVETTLVDLAKKSTTLEEKRRAARRNRSPIAPIADSRHRFRANPK